MLDPKLYNLSALLTNRIFIIPEYQRSYSWSSRQREDLFGDIEKVYEKSKGSEPVEHFMATLVCLLTKKVMIGTKEFDHLEVVDGQQRLTSLIILLKAIHKRLAKKSSDYLDLSKVLVKDDQLTTPILKTNNDSKGIFLSYIRNGKAAKENKIKPTELTYADRQLCRAFEESENFVNRWIAANRTLEDLIVIINYRLYFILHLLDNEAVVYKTFEVLNSRGLSVEWIDRFKSMLMGLIFENKGTEAAINDMHDSWADIYKLIGIKTEYGTMALRYMATLSGERSVSRVLSEEDSVKLLVDCCSKSVKQDFCRLTGVDTAVEEAAEVAETEEKATVNVVLNVINCSKCLLEFVRHIKALMQDARVEAVTKMQHARLLALAIQMNSSFTIKEKHKLLELWEKISFKLFGLMRRDSRYSIGDYTRAAYDIYCNQISYEEAWQRINGFVGNSYSIEDAITLIKKTNCYDEWGDSFRYLMYRRELYLAEKQKSHLPKKQWSNIWAEEVKETIEHILPQSDVTLGDKNMPENRKTKKVYHHRLGNLLVLEAHKNSSLQNKTPLVKAQSYNELLIEQEVRERIQQSKRWTLKEVKEREEELFEWMREEWA